MVQKNVLGAENELLSPLIQGEKERKIFSPPPSRGEMRIMKTPSHRQTWVVGSCQQNLMSCWESRTLGGAYAFEGTGWQMGAIMSCMTLQCHQNHIFPRKQGSRILGGYCRGWVEDRINPTDGASGQSRDIEYIAFCTPT